MFHLIRKYKEKMLLFHQDIRIEKRDEKGDETETINCIKPIEGILPDYCGNRIDVIR